MLSSCGGRISYPSNHHPPPFLPPFRLTILDGSWNIVMGCRTTAHYCVLCVCVCTTRCCRGRGWMCHTGWQELATHQSVSYDVTPHGDDRAAACTGCMGACIIGFTMYMACTTDAYGVGGEEEDDGRVSVSYYTICTRPGPQQTVDTCHLYLSGEAPSYL